MTASLDRVQPGTVAAVLVTVAGLVTAGRLVLTWLGEALERGLEWEAQ